MSIETIPGSLTTLVGESRDSLPVPAEVKYRFSLIVPCFNEEGAISRTITELRNSLSHIEAYELVIVNDGSTDGTAEILAQCAAEDPNLRVVTHVINRGYGAALKT